MRFDDAAARLSAWPAVLPPPGDIFMPVVTDERDLNLRRRPDIGEGRPAAVLVLVYPDEAGDARLVLIERTIDAWPLRYGHYEIDGLSVWGATARILSQLGAVLGSDPT